MQFIFYTVTITLLTSHHPTVKICNDNCSRCKREKTNQHREKMVIILRYMRLSMYMLFLEIDV